MATNTGLTVTVANDEDDYGDLISDILGETGKKKQEDDGNQSSLGFGKQATKSEADKTPYLLLDFRRGKSDWPDGVEVVNDDKYKGLLQKEKDEIAKKTAKKEPGKEGINTTGMGSQDMNAATVGFSGIYGMSWDSIIDLSDSDDSDKEDEGDGGDGGFATYKTLDDVRTVAPDDAKFELLSDGSTALVLKPGQRLKIELEDLYKDGMATREKRLRDKLKEGEGGAKKSDFSSYFTDMGGAWGAYAQAEMKDEYSITVDFKLLDAIPPPGLSLFQTALCHAAGGKDAKGAVRQTDGECKISGAGGVGNFGTFGDTSEAKIEPNQWNRVVVTVKCQGDGADNKVKGEMMTYLNGKPCAKIKRKEISSRDRFALNDKEFYLFSSGKVAMMGASVAIRTVRVDSKLLTPQEVKSLKAQDKVLSMHNENREKKIKEQRRGLALARLFPKPRPIWTAPALIGTFGDAFIEGKLDNQGLLPWTFVVLNHTFQRAIRERREFFSAFAKDEMSVVSDVALIFRQSRHVFKQMQKFLKTGSSSQLLTFLRKLRKSLREVAVGEAIVLPLLLEGNEVLLIFEGVSTGAYRLVVVNTNAEKGLKYHAVSVVEGIPKIKYRVCMVLDKVSKKNALDDVFWMAVYNLTLCNNQGDTDKFYDILLPFLTGKPLESSLVEAEAAAGAAKASGNKHGQGFGEWRSPQRSGTAYARAAMAAMHYLLRTRGLSSFKSKCVRVALRAQFVEMIQNDLKYVFPDQNGERVCQLACQQLSYAAVKLASKTDADVVDDDDADAADATNPDTDAGGGGGGAKADAAPAAGAGAPDRKGWSVKLLKAATVLVSNVKKSLDACRHEQITLPHQLDLTLQKRTQFIDGLLWETSLNEPNPGQQVSLSRYVPIDFMQLPVRAKTREEASRAIWLCDRLSTLIDNQTHCVKNGKLLIFSLIEHVFTQVVPTPKPRSKEHNRGSTEDLETTQLAAKRARKKALEKKAKKDAKKKGGRGRKKKKKQSGGHRGAHGGPAAAEAAKANSDDELEEEIAEFDEELEKAAAAEATGDEAKGGGGKAESKTEAADDENKGAAGLDTSPGDDVLTAVIAESCIWDQDVLFEEQLEMMQTLERINEHFCAAAMSIRPCKELDAVAIIVNGCIVAIGDAVMRRRATDHPSEACSHLMGQCRDGEQLGIPGFGLSVSSFASQTSTIELHQPELCVARTAVLDYFLAPEQQVLQKIFTWEESFKLRPTKTMMKYLRNVCREIAAPLTDAHKLLLTTEPKMSILHVNYPELKAYQNICFFWKFLLNPDLDARKNFTASPRYWRRMEVQLTWQWQNTEYKVKCFSGHELTCAPPKKYDEAGKPLPPPTHRYPSTATPSFYLPAPKIRTEDDVIYRPNLPGFQDEEEDAAVLGQRDSELLISYLTVPYLRVPLVTTFFSTDDRVHKLESEKLRDILDSVLFEPGAHLKLWMIGVAPVVVPTKHPDLLASPYGLLINELCHSPVPVMDAIMRLVQGALALDTGTVTDHTQVNFNSGVEIILYTIRLGSRVDNYLSFLIQYTTNTHATINKQDFELRGVHVSPATLAVLKSARLKLRQLLFGRFLDLLDSYLKRLDKDIQECGESSSSHANEMLSGKAILACDLHTHKLLLFRNVRPDDELVSDDLESTGGAHQPGVIDFSRILKNVLGSFIYLTTRHTWNGSLLVPENELYEILCVQRRRLVQWCNTKRQGPLDTALQSSLEISTSAAGAFAHQHADGQNRWSKIAGPRCGGRYAVASTRSNAQAAQADAGGALGGGGGAGDDSDSDDLDGISQPLLMRQKSWESPVGTVSESAFVGVELDLQIGQMTLRNRHLSALRPEILNHKDVKEVFGASGTIQASQLSYATNREAFRLVGLKHDVAYWYTADSSTAPVSDEWERQYDPSELFPSERWIESLFEPVRKSFYAGPQPPAMSFLMPEKEIPKNAEVAILLGEHQNLGGPFKLVYLFRRLKCVHVYECLTHGRQWWWSLHLTTDARFTLRDMQPNTKPRRAPFPYWWKLGAGSPYPQGVAGGLYDDLETADMKSVIVYREATHEQNLSGGREKFIPKRMLFGAVPDCVLEEYRFWQDESLHNWKSNAAFQDQKVYHRRLRGYPVDEEKTDTMIVMEFGSAGDWKTFLSSGHSEATASSLDTGDKDDEFKQSRRAAVLESTQMPGRCIRIYRVPFAKAKAQFLVHQRIASKLEGLALLSAQPSYVRDADRARAEEENDEDAEDDDAEGGGGGSKDKKKKKTKKGDREEGGNKFKPGDTVLFNLDQRWVSARINSINVATGDDTYNVSINLTGERHNNVDEDQLKKSKSRTTDIGEGIYHWEGMTDSEDDEWDPKGERQKKDTGGQVTKARLHFGHFEQLPLLFANCGGTEANVEKTLTRFKAFQLGQEEPHENVSSLVAAIHKQAKENDLDRIVPATTGGKAADGSHVLGEDGSMIPPQEIDVMLNMLYAPRSSTLHSVAVTLSRIENLSHITAWTTLDKCLRMHHAVNDGDNFDDSVLFGVASIKCVELPRLKLVFEPREGRLYSVDHADLFISNDRHELITNLIAGIPHALILSNAQDEKQLLVPVTCPARPLIRSQPFSTRLVMDREAELWYAALTQRYYLYPVHLSLSFLMTKGVNSALYLLLLRFLNRDYAAVSTLVDSIATDTKYSPEGLVIYTELARTLDDAHPDAHACRLKISLVTMDSPMKCPWDLTSEAARFINKVAHVSATNQIEFDEELQLLETDGVVKERQSPLFNNKIHTDYMITLVFNRLHCLRALGKAQRSMLKNGGSGARAASGGAGADGADAEGLEMVCRAPPRSIGSPWVYYEDNTVLGAKYDDVVEVQEEGELLDRLLASKYEEADCTTAGVDVESEAAHRLVVVFYYVKWMNDCADVTSRVKDLAAQFTMVTFVHAETDKIKWSKHLHRINDIHQFPKFEIYRNNTRQCYTTGIDKVVDALSTLLQQAITPEDRLIHRAQQRREDEEDRAKHEGEEEEVEEIPWIWDEEHMGERMSFDNQGFTVKLNLRGDDGGKNKGEKVVWEYSDGGDWQTFGKSAAGELEGWGHTLQQNDNSHERQLDEGVVWCNNTRWTPTQTELIGMKFEDGETGNEYDVRRRGPYFALQTGGRFGRQQEGPEDPAEAMKKKEEAMKKEMADMKQRTALLEGRGTDIEAVRGGMRIEPYTGVHRWDLVFAHQPARGGTCDAVGVASDEFATFGPSKTPLLGQDYMNANSCALYANGELYFRGQCVAFAIPPEKKKKESKGNKKDAPASPSKETGTGDKDGGAAAATAATTGDKDAAEADAEADEPETPGGLGGLGGAEAKQNLFFGQNSLVTCVLDTDAEGGTLSFELNGAPIKFRKNSFLRRGQQAEVLESFVSVFERLEGCAAVYPVVMTCPLDEFYEELEEENRRFKEKQKKQKDEQANRGGGPGGGKKQGGGRGKKANDSDSSESEEEEEEEITPAQLKQMAKFAKMPVSSLKKQEDKDLRKLWKKVQAELEAMRVTFPTIHIKISERAKRNLANQGGGKVKDIVPGTMLNIIVSPQVGNKKAKIRTVLVEEIVVEDATVSPKAKAAEGAGDGDAAAAAATTTTTEGDAEEDAEAAAETAAEVEKLTATKKTVIRLRVQDVPDEADKKGDEEEEEGEDEDDEDDEDYDEDEDDELAAAEAAGAAAAEEEGGGAKEEDGEEPPAVETFEITVDLLQFRVLDIAGERANYEYEHKEVVEEVKAEDTGPETIVWMIKRHGKENVWTQLPDTINENMEEGYNKFQTAKPSRSSNSGQQVNEVHMYIKLGTDSKYAVTFLKKRDKAGDDGHAMTDDGNQVPIRRFAVTSTGIQRQISLLSLNYNHIYSLRGRSCLEILQRVWNGGETMNGAAQGLGFLFLYNLLQGNLKARATSAWGGWSSTASDSPRLALLISQLYVDRREKSLCNSIVNVLNRNRSACIRMPKYRDTRKFNHATIHNGWQDAAEPSSGLASHMLQITYLFEKLRKARGMLSYPPKPPYDELKPPPSTCLVPIKFLPQGYDAAATATGDEDAAPAAATTADGPVLKRADGSDATGPAFQKKKNKFAVSDFSCNERFLEPVTADSYRQLFDLLKQETRSSVSSNVWQILSNLADGSRLLPKPICEVDTVKSFEDKMREIAVEGIGGTSGENGLLAVVKFHANWCPPCKALSPALRIFALKMPTARFVSVDVDDCDGLAQRYGVKSMPTVIVLRPRLVEREGKMHLTNIDRPLHSTRGGGPHVIVELTAVIADASTEAERKVLAQTIDLSLFDDEKTKAAKKKKKQQDSDNVVDDEDFEDDGNKEPEEELEEPLVSMASLESTMESIAVSEEECVSYSTDQATLDRLAGHPFDGHDNIMNILSHEPYVVSAEHENFSELPFDVSRHPDAKSGVAVQMIARMQKDIAYVAAKRASSSVSTVANLSHAVFDAYFSNDEKPFAGARRALRAARGKVAKLLRVLNDLKAEDTRIVEATPPLLEAAANNIGLSTAAGSDGAVDEVTRKLKFQLNRIAGKESNIQMQLLYRSLLSSKSIQDLLAVNPFITPQLMTSLLHVSVACILRGSRLGHTNRCIVAATKLQERLDKALGMTAEQAFAIKSSLRPSLEQSCSGLAGLLLTKRHFCRPAPAPASTAVVAGGAPKELLKYDPRYLLFEFVWNIILREKQVVIVDNFMDTLAQGRSKVKQMIMGQGKTTVVAPMLALMLADGTSLVLSVVPPALLEMSRTLMRETFANIMAKRIYTLKFDRSTVIRPAMYRSLQNSVLNRGVVVATPTSVKSVMLCFIESLNNSADIHKPAEAALQRSRTREFTKVLGLFRAGVMLLDEVDMILHPLRSELNFPIGAKFDLDGSERGERWSLPIHLIDAIFYAEDGKMHVFETSAQALAILSRLKEAVAQGYEQRSLQRLPHITLLDFTFYYQVIKPILADWAFLWLQKNHLHGVDRADAVRYIMDGAAAKSLSLRVLTSLTEDAERTEQTFLSGGDGGNAYHKGQVAFLRTEIARSEERLKLIDSVYDAETLYEQGVQDQGKALAKLQGEIAKVKKVIDDAECPPDDSMFNQVVVVVSGAFVSAAKAGGSGGRGGRGASGASDVNTLCTDLEAMGYYVRQCDSIKEATARIKELHISKKLRCVVFDVYDYTKQKQQQNSFHNSLNPSSPKTDITFSNISLCLSDLTDEASTFAIKYQAVPSCRFSSLDTMSTLVYADREYCWQTNVEVHEKPSKAIEWVDVDGEFAGFEPEETTALSAAEMQERRKELDDLQKHKADLAHACEESSEVHQAKMLGIFSALSESLQKDVAVIDAAIAKTAGFAAAMDQLPKPAPAAAAPAAPVASVQVRLRGPALTVELSAVRSWGGLMEAVSQAAGAFIDSDSVITLANDANATPGGTGATSVATWEAYVAAGGGDFAVVQPRYSAELVLHMLDVPAEQWLPRHLQRSAKHFQAQAGTMTARLTEHREYLQKISLAAAVMAKVPVQQKKLLNLAHDWLHTFLPHCMKKVNRVSFGLLNDQECKNALAVDPLLPPSRLKLGVPFVGKDVPSNSSEFAHPDIILGLTVFAYRYQGLRRADFNDLMDLITASFTHEIGPPNDRPSSVLYRQWVLDAGGAIRGDVPTDENEAAQAAMRAAVAAGDDGADDDSKEVVDLKYLQRNNTEQMGKLYNLWKAHPAVLYHYLTNTIFPKHMRSQHTKISACGQAVGGDMLFGRRLGFSGTPSDLLPKELGQCDYEKGDDGKMMSTIMDTSIFDVEHFHGQWTIEGLLHSVANHTPEFHALIDTGALITGYSNEEVAAELLKRGLEGFDGVVFLDDDDVKKVLIRATGRIVNQDQCGIPLTRRFAFYDQIHTTGMDIKHRVNARAAVTLGKDMVFRDYVQGAYRMRGIGQGQVVTVFIIPEVAELMQRQLLAGKIIETGETVPEMATQRCLAMIAAWLIINSMQTEQVQWTMLCIQNIANLYRKTAFNRLLGEHTAAAKKDEEHDEEAAAATAETEGAAAARGKGEPQADGDGDAATPAPDGSGPGDGEEAVGGGLSQNRSKELMVFDESIDFSLDEAVPDPVPFLEKLKTMMATHEEYLESAECGAVSGAILDEVGRFMLLDGREINLDTEQEREQEQEQEKEVQAKKDQQIEVEKFVDREYNRSKEAPDYWPTSILAEPKQQQGGHAWDDTLHPFYDLSSFKLRHQSSIEFPDYIMASTNYFNRAWTGLRRLKNVVMILEWVPSIRDVRRKVMSPEDIKALLTQAAADSGHAGPDEVLQKAFQLLSFEGKEHLTANDVRNAIEMASFTNTPDAMLADIMRSFGQRAADGGTEVMDFQAFSALLQSGRIYKKQTGRYWVAVNLSEAETLRRLIHVKQAAGQSLIEGSDAAIALRYSPATAIAETGPADKEAGAEPEEEASRAVQNKQLDSFCGIVFDGSTAWNEVFGEEARPGGAMANLGFPDYQRAVVHSSFRFFDNDAHFSKPAVNTLIQTLENTPPHLREKFFLSSIGCRRRMALKPSNASMKQIFQIAKASHALKQRAQVSFLRQAIAAHRLTLYEAFLLIDANSNGYLDPAELFGAIDFFHVPATDAEDLVDFFQNCDPEGGGTIDYRQWLEVFDEDAERDDEDEEQAAAAAAAAGDGSDSDDDDKQPAVVQDVVKVTPRDALLLRKIITQRRQQRKLRQREDRLRQQAQQLELDEQIYRDELITSAQKHKDGSNPKILAAKDVLVGDGASAGPAADATITYFHYHSKRLPLRHQPVPANATLEFQDSVEYTEQELKQMGPVKSRNGYETTQIPPRMAWCYIKYQRLLCGRFCSRDYTYISMEAEQEHNLKVQAIRDRKPESSYLSCPSGAGFSLQLLPEEAPLGYTVVVQVRLAQLPIPGKLASVVSVVPPVVIAAPGAADDADQLKQVNFFVDSDGNVGLTRAADTKPEGDDEEEEEPAAVDGTEAKKDAEGGGGGAKAARATAAADKPKPKKKGKPQLVVRKSDGALKANAWSLVAIHFEKRSPGDDQALVSVRVVSYEPVANRQARTAADAALGGVELTCPEGRALEAFATPTAGFYCDGCKGKQDKGAQMLGNRQSDYDLCLVCATAEAAKINAAKAKEAEAGDEPTTGGEKEKKDDEAEAKSAMAKALAAAVDSEAREAETTRLPYYYPSGLLVLNGASVADARGGDVCQVGVVAWNEAPQRPGVNRLLAQFDAGLLDPIRLKGVLDQTEGLYAAAGHAARLRYDGGSEFVLDTYPRSAVGFDTATGRYFMDAEKAARHAERDAEQARVDAIKAAEEAKVARAAARVAAKEARLKAAEDAKAAAEKEKKKQEKDAVKAAKAAAKEAAKAAKDGAAAGADAEKAAAGGGEAAKPADGDEAVAAAAKEQDPEAQAAAEAEAKAAAEKAAADAEEAAEKAADAAEEAAVKAAEQQVEAAVKAARLRHVVSSHRVRFVPVLLRPFAKRAEFQFKDVDDDKPMTVYQRTITTAGLADLQMQSARLAIPARQTKFYEGPHMLKALALVLLAAQDPKEKDVFVRLAAEQKIAAHLVDKVAADLHRFLRKPVKVLVDMLRFCGYLTVVPDSEEPLLLGKAADATAAPGQWPAADLADFGPELQQRFALFQKHDTALTRKLEPLLRRAESPQAEREQAEALDMLRAVLRVLGRSAEADGSVEALRTLVRSPDFRVGSVTGPTMVLLRNAAGASAYKTPAPPTGVLPEAERAGLREQYASLSVHVEATASRQAKEAAEKAEAQREAAVAAAAAAVAGTN